MLRLYFTLFYFVVFFNCCNLDILAEENNNSDETSAILEYCIGDENALITVVEYASFSCSHCSEFSRNVFPVLKSRYIETGKVRFIFRPVPTDSRSLYATTVLYCANLGKSDESYFDLYSKIFEISSNILFYFRDYKEGFRKVVGINENDTCLSNPDTTSFILTSNSNAVKSVSIIGVPTFLINGKRIDGYTNSDAFFAELDEQISLVTRDDSLD